MKALGSIEASRLPIHPIQLGDLNSGRTSFQVESINPANITFLDKFGGLVDRQKKAILAEKEAMKIAETRRGRGGQPNNLSVFSQEAVILRQGKRYGESFTPLGLECAGRLVSLGSKLNTQMSTLHTLLAPAATIAESTLQQGEFSGNNFETLQKLVSGDKTAQGHFGMQGAEITKIINHAFKTQKRMQSVGRLLSTQTKDQVFPTGDSVAAGLKRFRQELEYSFEGKQEVEVIEPTQRDVIRVFNVMLGQPRDPRLTPEMLIKAVGGKLVDGKLQLSEDSLLWQIVKQQFVVKDRLSTFVAVHKNGKRVQSPYEAYKALVAAVKAGENITLLEQKITRKEKNVIEAQEQMKNTKITVQELMKDTKTKVMEGEMKIFELLKREGELKVAFSGGLSDQKHLLALVERTAQRYGIAYWSAMLNSQQAQISPQEKAPEDTKSEQQITSEQIYNSVMLVFGPIVDAAGVSKKQLLKVLGVVEEGNNYALANENSLAAKLIRQEMAIEETKRIISLAMNTGVVPEGFYLQVKKLLKNQIALSETRKELGLFFSNKVLAHTRAVSRPARQLGLGFVRAFDYLTAPAVSIIDIP